MMKKLLSMLLALAMLLCLAPTAAFAEENNHSGDLPKSLTIMGATVTGKTYDGTTDATVTAVSFDGLEDGDTLVNNEDYTVSNAKYDGVNATGDGAATKVTFTVTLKDTETAKKYTLTDTVGEQPATISKATKTGGTLSTVGYRGLMNSYPVPDEYIVDGGTVFVWYDYAGVSFGTIFEGETFCVDGVVNYKIKSTIPEGTQSSMSLHVISNNYENYVVEINVTVAERNIEINATNFPDGTFRTYVKENFDTDGNNILSTSELAAVTEIDCSNQGISDLTGIEYFTNLTVLHCSHNQLTLLDISKNTNLTELLCQMNQLTSLDVSNCINLKKLRCENNQLTSLDVRNDTMLNELKCYNNQLSSLDLSDNTWLDLLDCSNNWLTLLDISNNTRLTALKCSNNQLTSLDLSVYSRRIVLISDDNSYAITATNGVFDLSTLPGSFDVSRVSSWVGATEENGKLTITDPSKVTYTYDCRNGQSVTFTLTVTHMHNHAWSADWSSDETAHWHDCTAAWCPITDNSEKDGYAEHSGGTATCTQKAVCDYCGNSYGDLAPHELTHKDAKDATAAETGNTEYWYCAVCNKYFSDENAANEIKLADTVISKLAPKIIAGDGATVTEGEKKALSFTSDAAFEDFLRVEVDGKTVNESSYTVKSGSTVVTLNADYVATLSVGEHTLGIVSESGTAAAKFTVNKKAAEMTVDNSTKSPQTGDGSNLALWIAVLLISGGAVVAVRKKKQLEN